MSHISKIEVNFNNKKALERTVKKLGVKTEQVVNYKFYDGTIKSGLALNLKNWRYPAVITDDGGVFFDNYNGSWGDIKELNSVRKEYSAELVREKLRGQGIAFTEKKVGDEIKIYATV